MGYLTVARESTSRFWWRVIFRTNLCVVLGTDVPGIKSGRGAEVDCDYEAP